MAMVKRALCVGIDQVRLPGVPWLQGCCSDARAMKHLLTERFGFAEVGELYNQEATRAGILRSLDWLARVSAPGDIAMLYVASYGSWFPPVAGHEDALDEIIVVYDHDWQGTMLRDDDVVQALGRMHREVAVGCVFDMCHAGPTGPGIRCLAPPAEIPQVAWARHRGLLVRPRFACRRPEDHPNLIYLAACSPNESAVEVSTPHGMAGAFTLALTDWMGGLSTDVAWEQVPTVMTQALRAKGMRQTPQLHGPAYQRSQSAFWGLSADVSQAVVPSARHGAAWQAMSSPGFGASTTHAGVSVPQAPRVSWAMPAAVAQAPSVPMSQGRAVVASMDVMTRVDTALREFDESDYTVKLCRAVFAVVPYVPRPQHYTGLGDAVQAMQPGAGPEALALARAHAQSEAVSQTLWVASAIDTGDAGIAVYSGLRSAVALLRGGRSDAFETDPQQAVDATLKLLAISYLIYRLFPGSVADRVKGFYAIPAGQSLAAYYAAVEVALPFADNALAAGGSFLHKMLVKYGGTAGSTLASKVGKDAVEGSQGVLNTILAPMEGMVQRVLPMARQVAETASNYLPTALNVADKVAGVVATGADALPVYRYLGARLTAEACASFGLRGIPVS